MNSFGPEKSDNTAEGVRTRPQPMNDHYIFRRFGAFREGENFKRRVACVGLGLDDPALGVVVAEVGGEREEPGFGVLVRERRERC